MAETIYAAFADPHQAESAAGALLDYGVRADDLSLVVSEEYKKRHERQDSQPEIVAGTAYRSTQPDPLGNTQRMPPAQIPGEGQIAGVQNDLNPAQNDYPRTGAESPTELSSRPPNARYDFNPDLDNKGYNKDYLADVDRENRSEAARDLARRMPDQQAPEADRPVTETTERPAVSGAPATPPATEHPYDPERAAKGGVTTTTLGDAASAAKKGVGIGLGVGALAAVAAITIPGFGIVLGGGALATAVAGIAASAGAGAVAGGVVGYLKDQGVPAAEIPKYKDVYDQGGAILQIALGEGQIDRAKIKEVLQKYGAQQVGQYGYAA